MYSAPSLHYFNIYICVYDPQRISILVTLFLGALMLCITKMYARKDICFSKRFGIFKFNTFILKMQLILWNWRLLRIINRHGSVSWYPLFIIHDQGFSFEVEKSNVILNYGFLFLFLFSHIFSYLYIHVKIEYDDDIDDRRRFTSYKYVFIILKAVS